MQEKRGRPLHVEHVCNCCGKDFKNAASKASHEYHMKKSKGN